MTALAFSGYSALMPVAPLWAAAGGADAGGVGLVNGVLMGTTVLTQLMVPASLRKFGWVLVLVTGTLFLGLPTIRLFFSDSLEAILAVSALRGIGFGIITVTGSALIAELVDPLRRGEAIGVYGLAVAAPQILFMSTGPWFAERFGFATMFAIGVLPIFGAVPAYILGGRMEAVPKPQERAPYTNLLRPIFLLLAVTLAGGAIITFLAQMVSEPWLAMVGLLLLTVFAAATRWRLGGLADRFGAQRFVWPLVVSTTVGMVVIAYAVRGDSHVAALLTGTALVGIGYGGLQNLTLLLAFDGVKRVHYGSASAAWNIGFDAGTGLGSVVIGAVAASSSFSTAMLVGGAVSLLTLPLAFKQTPKVTG